MENPAMFAGLSRQTVNRALKSMEEQGLLSLDFGRVTILDADALAVYAAPSAA